MDPFSLLILVLSGALAVFALGLAVFAAAESFKSRVNRRHVDQVMEGIDQRLESTVGHWRAKLARHAGGPGADDTPKDRASVKDAIRKKAQRTHDLH